MFVGVAPTRRARITLDAPSHGGDGAAATGSGLQIDARRGQVSDPTRGITFRIQMRDGLDGAARLVTLW
jgi:hypothetical protein